MKLLAIVFCAAGLAAAQTQPLQELPRWVLDLSRIKRHARDTFGRLPDYVCVETVERYRRHADRPWEKIDSVTFEVANVGHKEIYAPVGATRFDLDDLSPFVTSGFIGTGSFSSMTTNLFVSDVARFTWPGEDHSLIRTALRYDYTIPAMMRPFHLQSGSIRASVGVRGSFWADPESLDIQRIRESAVDIPAELNMRSVDTSIDYERVRIGSSMALLPKTAEQVVTDFAGGESRNFTVFSGCREFTSRSLIHFGTQAPGRQ